MTILIGKIFVPLREFFEKTIGLISIC